MLSIRVGAILAACVLLSSCGGGSGEDAGDRFVGQRAQAAAANETPPGVSVAEAARQLMDFGEASYPALFPGHPDTATFGDSILYRYYPGTGNYLGVATDGSAGFLAGGVYVMGTDFGPAPVLMGPLSSFITPQVARQTIELANNAVVADLQRGVFYASVPSSVVGKGNRIATINATTGAMTLSSPVGSEPGELAIAADGQSLYVGIDGSAELLRLSLPGMQVMGRVRMPYNAAITSLAASPNAAGMVVASLGGSAVLVRDMVAQPKMLGIGHPVTFGADGNAVFGLDTDSSGFRLTRGKVAADGLVYDKEAFADTGYYWHAVGRAGSRIITRNKLWDAADLRPAGVVGVSSECMERSSTRLICTAQGFASLEPARALIVDADSLTILAELALPYETDTSRPVLGPGATLLMRQGIDHPARRMATRLLIIRDEALR